MRLATQSSPVDVLVVGNSVGGWIAAQQFRQKVQSGRIDQRLITLQINHDIDIQVLGDLGHAVGAAGVVGAGHHGLAAEGDDGVDDPRVVRGDDHPREPGGLPGGGDDVANERRAGVGEEGFAGQAG